MNSSIRPEWLSLKDGSRYSGFGTRLLEELIRDGVIVSSLARRPGRKRGKRVINRASLDAYIEAGIGGKQEFPQG